MNPKSSQSTLIRFFARSRTLRQRAFHGLVVDELLPRGGDSRRALEVGCGSGELLAKLRALGWRCEGLEWDSRAAAKARERSGCPVGVGTLEEFDEPSVKYDLIVLHHVFEHLSKPIETIKALQQLLNPGGRAVLIYPNQDSLGAKMFREFWLHWDPPRHLFFTSRSGIRELASKHGFRFSARTGSRAAEVCSAISRSYRSGVKPGHATKVDGLDKLYKAVQMLMIFVGLHVGDEILVTLRKR
ncbi:MAG: class I SAM-dependent methyltransferase [bacterium]|nr:class I SAM-dependent methyltransferase [bacterium]